MPKLSWNRDDDGVVTIYATQGEHAPFPVADFWLRPAMKDGALTRPQASALQQQLVEFFVDRFNQEHAFECPIGSEGCTKDCGSYGCGN